MNSFKDVLFLHIVPTNKKLKNVIAQNLNEIAFPNKSNFEFNLIIFNSSWNSKKKTLHV